MIRLATEQDTRQIRDLWEYCFDDSPEFIDFFFQSCYRPENTLITAETNRVCSCLQLLPYRMQLRERPVDVCYIVGVATWPEYRGRGYAAQLLQYVDTVLHERNIYLSILLPFQYDFYRKFGWEVCYDLLAYREIEVPRHWSKITGSYLKIDISRDVKILSDCYLHFMNRFHGFMIRNQDNWEKTIRDVELDHGTGYRYVQDNITTGYILYTVCEKELCIRELVYRNPEAKEALLQLAFHHMGQVDRILWKAPSIDTTYLTMKDSRGRLAKETFVMGRIHDITGALSGIPFHGDPVVLRVFDPAYPGNSDCYLLKEENGVSGITGSEEEPDIETDIRILTQLLWGYLPVDLALAEGYLKCKEKGALSSLNAIFPPRNNFMTEEY